MSAITSSLNRWGDHPPVVQGRLWPPALVAFVLAILTVLVALLATLVAFTWQTSPVLHSLLMLLLKGQLSLVQFPVVIAYVVLCVCRPSGVWRGRGLAWAAIGISYAALVWQLLLAAAVFPQLTGPALGVLAMGALHLPVFAAESRFARNAVAALVIGGIFFSLLMPWLHHTREVSRRLRCMDNLRQMGMHLQQSESLGNARSEPALDAITGSDVNTGSSRWIQSLFDSIEPAASPFTLPTTEPPGTNAASP